MGVLLTMWACIKDRPTNITPTTTPVVTRTPVTATAPLAPDMVSALVATVSALPADAMRATPVEAAARLMAAAVLSAGIVRSA